MTTPNAENEPAGQRRADVPRPDDPQPDRASDPSRSRRSSSQNVHPENFEHAEAALGGADTVQKTSYVVGEGTEPAGAPRAGVVARTTTGGGVNFAAWAIGIIALLVALVYGFGILR